MAITRPVTKTIISTSAFGVPVADELNALRAWVTANTPTQWFPMNPLLNGFVNLAGPRSVSSYRKRGDMVDVRVGVGSGPPNSLIFTLPAGYRPPGTLDIYGRDIGGPGLFNVSTDGGIAWYGSAANNASVMLIASFSTTP